MCLKYHLEFNKTLVNHPNYDYIINKVQYFQNKCGCSEQLFYSP